MTRPDSDIREDVLRELAWEGRLCDAEVGVQVSDGVVVLGGVVETPLAARAAAEAAHRVADLRDVVSELVVRCDGEVVDDLTVARNVRQALSEAPGVPGGLIRTTVARGVVTLQGTVRTGRQRRSAERAARHAAGVARVENLLALEAEVGAAAVARAIQRALKRHAGREEADIEVAVIGGHLSVKGPVASEDERQVVLGAVRGLPGVEAVEEQLEVGA
jgi:osmotically-inducible protein OsmY